MKLLDASCELPAISYQLSVFSVNIHSLAACTSAES